MEKIKIESVEITDTPQTLARALKTTPQTIGNWHRKGIIPSVFHCGRIIRFNRDQVIQSLKQQTNRSK